SGRQRDGHSRSGCRTLAGRAGDCPARLITTAESRAVPARAVFALLCLARNPPLMSQVLDELVALLSLETIEENLFRGASQDLGFPQLFGGQVLGQALSAACQTVIADRHVHSLHGYFLRAGDALLPVVYQVERVRDGGSFSTRRVTAIQKGQPIFFCSASFQADEPGFEHQPSMPEGIEAPENLPSEMDLFSPHAERIPQPMRDK